MGSEESTSYNQTQRETNTGNSEPYDHSNTNYKGEMPMRKHPYQTCLRMPLSLKEDMTSICDRYHINESDLMRRAIVQFVENIQQNPNQNSRYMFL